jgi:curli biogenesis system outer membrane secretion channel CsgG
MKKLYVLLIVIFLLSLGCNRVHSYAKPEVNFSAIKKIAIIKFGLQNEPLIKLESKSLAKSDSQGTTKFKSHDSIKLSNDLSEIVTDAMTLAFMQKGFDIIERNLLKSLVNEDLIIQSGLTESERQVLTQTNIDSVVIGTIYVEQKRLVRQSTELSFSLKMIDTRNGKLIWSANVIEVDFDELNKVAKKIADTIPMQ